jgi:hypothetical protein
MLTSVLVVAFFATALADTTATSVTIQQSIDLSIAAIVLASVAIVALGVVLILRTQRCSRSSSSHHHSSEPLAGTRSSGRQMI